MSPAHMCAGDFAVQRGSARGHRRPARRQGASGACWHYWSQARRRVAVRLCASAACDTLANSRRVHHDATSRRPAPALASLGRARAHWQLCAAGGRGRREEQGRVQGGAGSAERGRRTTGLLVGAVALGGPRGCARQDVCSRPPQWRCSRRRRLARRRPRPGRVDAASSARTCACTAAR